MFTYGSKIMDTKECVWYIYIYFSLIRKPFFDQAKAEKMFFLCEEADLILEERKKKSVLSGRRCK